MSENVPENRGTPVEFLWEKIYTGLQKDEVEFFLNSHLEPMVLIPQDGFSKEWLVDSQRFQDLLISMAFEITRGILKTAEREFMLSQIREECRRGGRRQTEEESLKPTDDVVLRTIIVHVKDVGVFSGRTNVLQETLRKLQKDRQIASLDPFPVFTNQFSRKLNRLIPVLQDYGVSVVFEHKEDGSYCTLTKLKSFALPPEPHEVAAADGEKKSSSGSSSGIKPITGSPMQQSDGADSEVRFDDPGAKAGLMNSPSANLQKPAGPKPASDAKNIEPSNQVEKKGGAQ